MTFVWMLSVASFLVACLAAVMSARAMVGIVNLERALRREPPAAPREIVSAALLREDRPDVAKKTKDGATAPAGLGESQTAYFSRIGRIRGQIAAEEAAARQPRVRKG